MDIRQFACGCCGSVKDPSDEFLQSMIGPLLVCTKDKNTAVKTGSERALIDLLLLKTENNRMKVVVLLLLILLLFVVLYGSVGWPHCQKIRGMLFPCA